MRLLIVEDDPLLGPQLKHDLARAGLAVDLADNGRDGEILGNIQPYDIAVLDLGLPQKSGLDVLRAWRKKGNVLPVIVLTARDTWQERVDGFQAGADDYLGKPFHTEELIARINALLKRSKLNTAGQLHAAGLLLDEDRQLVVTAIGEECSLTATEFRLLRYFMLHPNKVLSKSILTEHVYDNDSDKDSNVLEVYVKRLRNKFGQGLIETKRGQGYIFRV